MKKLDKSICREVLKRLGSNRSFEDSMAFAKEKSLTKPYFVGGKLYRTLVEILFEHPARSGTADYDWATEKAVPKSKRIPSSNEVKFIGNFENLRAGGFKPVKKLKEVSKGCYCKVCHSARRVSATQKYSGDSYVRRSKFGAKFDLIDINSLKDVEGISIEGYLAAVPLSIQSIAMDVEKLQIFGTRGIESIIERYVGINNLESLLGYAANKRINPNKYIENKAKSLRFLSEKFIAQFADGHLELNGRPKQGTTLKATDFGGGINFVPSSADNIATTTWPITSTGGSMFWTTTTATTDI